MAVEIRRSLRLGQKTTHKTGALCSARDRRDLRVVLSKMRTALSVEPVAMREESLLKLTAITLPAWTFAIVCTCEHGNGVASGRARISSSASLRS
jgi:hypothetical protein